MLPSQMTLAIQIHAVLTVSAMSMAEDLSVPACRAILVDHQTVARSAFSAQTVNSARHVSSKSVLILVQAPAELMLSARLSIITQSAAVL